MPPLIKLCKPLSVQKQALVCSKVINTYGNENKNFLRAGGGGVEGGGQFQGF